MVLRFRDIELACLPGLRRNLLREAASIGSFRRLHIWTFDESRALFYGMKFLNFCFVLHWNMPTYERSTFIRDELIFLVICKVLDF